MKTIFKTIYQTQYRFPDRNKKEGNDNKKNKMLNYQRNIAIFGKAIENPMNKVDVKLVTTRKQYLY